MSTNGLSPAGTSTYDSSTMYVGDGTWDSDRNTFLLPNLQGLNFDTMRYNGMGNRFRDLPEYHSLVLGHGVIATITFLGIVPAAIFIARFMHVEGRAAYKLHVYLQIITVFLATVVLVLGWFAVGPERSLSNPHHGIGVTIYTCVLVQFIYGWWMSRRERKRDRPHPTIPLKVHIHRLFGRAIALLAFVQVALGLTLYGSPRALFILYALWGALLLFAYLALEYRNKPRIGAGAPLPARSDYYSDYSGSYLTGDPTELTQDGRRRERRRSSHWGEKALAGVGAIGAYEWWKTRKERREDERLDRYEERMRRQNRPQGTPSRPDSSYGPPATLGPPQPGYGPPSHRGHGRPSQAGYGPPSQPGQRPPGPGYGPSPAGVPPPAGYNPERAPSRGSQRGRRQDGTIMSPESWEEDEYDDDKYTGRPSPRRSGNWRDRILGAGAGIAAFEGVKSLFGSRKRRNDGYVDSQVGYHPSQTDVSRVEAGQAPFSPNTDPRRNQRIPMPDPMTPTRPPPRRRPSATTMTTDDDETHYGGPHHRQGNGDETLRQSIALLGPIAGFREWNAVRRRRREQQRLEKMRQDELDNEEQRFNKRTSNSYPRPQDASGRRQSMSGTIMTGPTGPDPALGSNPELSRHNFRPDTLQPPLPAAAGAIPPPSASGAPPSTVGPSISQQHVPPPPLPQQQQQQVPFNLPPPPPGPPPNAVRPADYQAPAPGSMQMPQGAVNPDPSRLVQEQQAAPQSQNTSDFYRDGTTTAATEAAAAGAGMAAATQRTQSQSPSRRRDSRTRFQLPSRRGSNAAASGSALNSNSNGGAQSPPVSVKVNMHPDGRHVTLRRLPEEEAARLREERRRERRSRRTSSLSSGGEEPSSSRYRRGGSRIRRSSDQPITNVPPPPAMSNSVVASSLRRDSELNLPPVPPPQLQGRTPQPSQSPQDRPPGLLPAAPPSVGSPGPVGSSGGGAGAGGTDLGTGTDLSNFENNRKRRRAERARRLEAARGGNRVEFS